MPIQGTNPSDPTNTQYTAYTGATSQLTAAQFAGGIFTALLLSGLTAATTPTAANIIAALVGAIPVNAGAPYSYVLRVYNTNAGTLTITAGSGVTITGTATIATAKYRDYLVTVDSSTTVTMKNIGSGTAD